MKSFPLIISVKQIYYSLRNFRKLLPPRIHKYRPKLCNLFPLDFFANILHIIRHISLSSSRSIHFFFYLFLYLFVWKYVYSLYLFYHDSIIILKFLPFHETIQQEIHPSSTKISPKSFYSPAWIINNPRCSPRRWSAEARHLETRFETISAILRPVAIPRKRNS